MHWEKEIRIRITLRRIVGTIVAASTVTNLIIAGTALGANAPPAPTSTSAPFTSFSTPTVSVAPSITIETSAPALTDLPGITLRATDTPSIDTLTPTQTSTDVPISILCIKKFYWPAYYVQPGDRLSLLALDIESSVEELMAANCLTNDRIYAGQRLFMPSLPILLSPTFTTTATSTPTPTATETPTSTATSTATATPSATITATQTPTTTATASQTATYTSTATTASAAFCEHAELIADLTDPPGTVMTPGAIFTKTWRFKNIGYCTWTPAYAIVYMDGGQFGAPDSTPLLASIAPGQTVDVSIEMIAPSNPGSHIGWWMFRSPGGTVFGLGPQANDSWTVEITVSDQTPADTPTVFEKPNGYPVCNDLSDLYFSVVPVDPQGIRSVTVFYSTGKGAFADASMGQSGSTYYYGLGRSTDDIVSYYFEASDGLENVTRSETYRFSATCPGTPVAGYAIPENR